MTFNLDCAGRSYRAAPEVLDRPRHDAYADAVGASRAEGRNFDRPLACFAAVYLLGPIVPQLFQDPKVGLDLEHLLHGEQEFSFTRKLSFDESINPTGVIAQVDRRRGMVFLDFRCTAKDQAGEVVTNSRSLFVVKENP
ncbi:MAG: FAS1-like dehydratase domain-containing protein [Candidatus Dormibacteria bacterium]